MLSAARVNGTSGRPIDVTQLTPKQFVDGLTSGRIRFDGRRGFVLVDKGVELASLSGGLGRSAARFDAEAGSVAAADNELRCQNTAAGFKCGFKSDASPEMKRLAGLGLAHMLKTVKAEEEKMA